MKKSIQYLLVGFPYSGKTTLAKELEKRLGFARINIDQIKFDKAYTDIGDDDVPDKVWEEIFDQADKLIVQYLNEGKNLANEYAWITKEWRNRASKIAKDAGFETKLIYIKISPKIIRQRYAVNSKTKTRFHMPEKEFERVFTEFEEPTENENIIIYDQTIPLEKWIDKNIR